MMRRIGAGLLAAPLVMLGWSLPASAATVTVDDVPGEVIELDDDSVERDFAVEVPGSVAKVNIEVDFANFDDIGGGSCDPFAPGTGMPYFSETELRLTSPAGTAVDLHRPRPDHHFAFGETGSGVRVSILFDDDGAPLPTIPEDGTFQPVDEAGLAAFIGEPAAGDWTLTVGDNANLDPLCYYGATLRVETNEHPPVAADSTATTAFDTPVAFTVQASDADGDPLTYTIDGVSGIGGTVECEPAGGPDCVYTPPEGVSGEAIVDFTVSDQVDTDTGQVRITVEDEPPYVAELTLSASATEVDAGQTIVIEATGTDQYGDELGDVTEDVVFTSDVDTDVIEANQVTFPTASEHTITATHVDGASAQLTVTVLAADPPPVDEDRAPPGETTLPATGATAGPWSLTASLLLLGLGTAALWFRRHLSS